MKNRDKIALNRTALNALEFRMSAMEGREMKHHGFTLTPISTERERLAYERGKAETDAVDRSDLCAKQYMGRDYFVRGLTSQQAFDVNLMANAAVSSGKAEGEAIGRKADNEGAKVSSMCDGSWEAGDPMLVSKDAFEKEKAAEYERGRVDAESTAEANIIACANRAEIAPGTPLMVVNNERFVLMRIDEYNSRARMAMDEARKEGKAEADAVDRSDLCAKQYMGRDYFVRGLTSQQAFDVNLMANAAVSSGKAEGERIGREKEKADVIQDMLTNGYHYAIGTYRERFADNMHRKVNGS